MNEISFATSRGICMRPAGIVSMVRRSLAARVVAAASLTLSSGLPSRAAVVGSDSLWVTLPTTPGNWTDNVNWNPIAPTTARDAIIQNGVGATANLGATAVARTLSVNGHATLRSGTLRLDANAGGLTMNRGAGTTLTLAASTALGNVLLTTPTATIGVTDTANGVDVGGYLETNVVNLAPSGSTTARLTVAGNLTIGNDGSGNAVQGSPDGTSGSAAAIISAGSIRVSVAATAGAADYNWIGTYGANDTLTASTLKVGVAGDTGAAENFGGSWTLSDTVIGQQAGATGNSVTVAAGGTIANDGEMFVGLGGSSNTLSIDGGGSVFDMSDSSDDLVIGSLAGATGNRVSVNDGSLVVDKAIIVGDEGSSNVLEIGTTAPGHVTAGGIEVGRDAETNAVLLDGGSTATLHGGVTLGEKGADNSFRIWNGSVMTLTESGDDFTIGYDGVPESDGNLLDVRHAGSKLVMQQPDSALWIFGVTGAGGTGNMALVRDGGTLEVDMVMVQAGGTLAGNASVVGTVSVAAGGVVAPGDGTDGSIGTLDVIGDADFSPMVGGPGLLEIDIDGILCDFLSVTGNLDVSGATLDLNFIGPAYRFGHVIAEYGTLDGTFGHVVDLPDGWYVDYNLGGHNRIALVPEPSAIVLVGVGLAGLVALRFRRRRPA